MNRLRTPNALGFFLPALHGAFGCPGSIENPEDFPRLPPCDDEDFDAPALFAAQCGSSACHEGDDPGGELDLISPGVFERLRGTPSTICEEFDRIDPDNPEESFLVLKMNGQQGVGCGERMPQISFLSREQISCVQRWVVQNVSGLVEDAGPRVDAGSRVDAGRNDGGGSDTGADATGADASDDAGVDAPEPVDCAAITAAGFEVCTMSADRCEAKSLPMMPCTDVCAAAGLRCTVSYDDVVGACERDMAGMTYEACEDLMHNNDYCVCER